MNQAQADGGAWPVLAREANEVEGFATLTEMSQMADIVAVAQATEIEGVRAVGGSEYEMIHFVQVRFQIIKAISDWDADFVLVEFDAPHEEALKAFEAQITELPPTVIALRHKGGDEAGLYRLVNSKSLWTEQPDGGLVAPLGEDAERRYQSELAEIQGLDDLADHLEAARR